MTALQIVTEGLLEPGKPFADLQPRGLGGCLTTSHIVSHLWCRARFMFLCHFISCKRDSNSVSAMSQAHFTVYGCEQLVV